MALRNLSLGLTRSAPMVRVGDLYMAPGRKPAVVTAETIGWAVIHLHEIERRVAHGGKRGRELVDLRLHQKRHIEELLAAFEEEVGRREGVVSMTSGHMHITTAARKGTNRARG